MIRAVASIVFLAPAAAIAQSSSDSSAAGAPHRMMQGQHMMMMRGPAPGGRVASETGQAAIGAIQEIVGILAADPKTDWSKVNIEALRQHLIDMNNVTLSAAVNDEPIEGGMRFDVTGEGPVQGSIRRMTMAHAAAMNGVDGWRFEAAEIEGGASLTVHAPVQDLDKLRGLGFIGVLTLGMHHQMHHLMIARGESPHG